MSDTTNALTLSSLDRMLERIESAEARLNQSDGKRDDDDITYPDWMLDCWDLANTHPSEWDITPPKGKHHV